MKKWKYLLETIKGPVPFVSQSVYPAPMMLTPLTLFAALVAPGAFDPIIKFACVTQDRVAVACVRAQSATIFPVALGPEANLQGEIIGSGGQVGTTFVLSGQTLGVEFTC